jgi:hypothetical protein
VAQEQREAPYQCRSPRAWNNARRAISYGCKKLTQRTLGVACKSLVLLPFDLIATDSVASYGIFTVAGRNHA